MRSTHFRVPVIRAMGAKQSTHRKFPRNPAPAPSSLLPDVQFRVLIIGRANAGKTSILQRVCDTTDSPEIYRSGLSGTRDRVRAHESFPTMLSNSSYIQVKLEPTMEVGRSYFCPRLLIMRILLIAWPSRH